MDVNMDKWLILTVLGIIGVASIYLINQWDNKQHDIQEEKELDRFKDNQKIIIAGVNESLHKIDNQTKVILFNMISSLNDTKDDAHTNRLILEEIINKLNITVVMKRENNNESETVGKISGLGIGKPQIIPQE